LSFQQFFSKPAFRQRFARKSSVSGSCPHTWGRKVERCHPLCRITPRMPNDSSQL